MTQSFQLLLLTVCIYIYDAHSSSMCGYVNRDLSKLSDKCRTRLVRQMIKKCNDRKGTLVVTVAGYPMTGSGCGFMCRISGKATKINLKNGIPCGPESKCKDGFCDECDKDECKVRFV